MSQPKSIDNANNPAITSETFTCKLTTPELQKRKTTIIKSLRQQILDQKELKNGYRYCFPETDAVLDELSSFIKSERMCCNFFSFCLTIRANKNEIWLSITGPQGVKDFIISELEFSV